MKATVIIITLVSTLLFSNCSDNVIYDWFDYSETLCADPWETNSSSDTSDIINEVENYLMNLNINIESIEMTGDNDIITCQACSCLSGRTIRVKADENNAADLLNIGFNYE